MIADGKHPARLFDITFGTTNSGAQLVSFVWDLTDCNERVSYAFAMTDSAGRPNRFAILVTRRWSLAWDGTDLDWFRAHREELLGTPALVQTRDEKFEWIAPLEGSGMRDEKSGEGGQRTGSSSPWKDTSGLKPLVFVPERLEALPECDANAEGSWALFLYLTEGSDNISQIVNWLNLVYSIKPRQRDLTPEDWVTVNNLALEMARKLTSDNQEGKLSK